MTIAYVYYLGKMYLTMQYVYLWSTIKIFIEILTCLGNTKETTTNLLVMFHTHQKLRQRPPRRSDALMAGF